MPHHPTRAELPESVLVCAQRLPVEAPPPSPPAPAVPPPAPDDPPPSGAAQAVPDLLPALLATDVAATPAEAATAAAAAAAEPSVPAPSVAEAEAAAADPAAGEAAPAVAAADEAARPAASTPTPPPGPTQPEAWALHACEPGAVPNNLLGCPAVCFSRPGGAAPAGLLQQEEVEAAAATALLLPEGPTLSSLHQLLEHVVAPWLAAQQEQQGGDASDQQGGSASTSQLLAVTHRFAAQVAAAAKHVRSEAALRLPVLPPGLDLGDAGAAAASEEAVLACERCMEEWVQQVAGLLQREGAARPDGPSPLAELAHWQARAEAYGGLLEQLSLPAVRAAQAVVERGSMDANLAAGFRAQLAELTRLVSRRRVRISASAAGLPRMQFRLRVPAHRSHTPAIQLPPNMAWPSGSPPPWPAQGLEARDNARFLATLERHLRVLEGGSMQAVADALPPLLNALRMVGRALAWMRPRGMQLAPCGAAQSTCQGSRIAPHFRRSGSSRATTATTCT